MRRTIKFRAKVIGYGAIPNLPEWAFGFPYPDECGVTLMREPIINSIDDYAVDKDTIGQFTGMYADGKEIYEGDILGSSDAACDHRRVVYWNAEHGAWWANNDIASISLHAALELNYDVIIGNIHDNPEIFDNDNNPQT